MEEAVIAPVMISAMDTPGPLGQLHALAHLAQRLLDQRIDLLRRACAALGQLADLVGHHGEPAAVLPCPRRLDGGVQRQQVGLVGDLGDHPHDPGDLLRALRDVLDGLHCLLHRAGPLLGLLHGAFRAGGHLLQGPRHLRDRLHHLFHGGGGLRDGAGLRLRMLRHLLHGGGELLDGRGCFLQRGGLALRALGQLLRRAGKLLGAGGKLPGPFLDLLREAAQVVPSCLQRLGQLADLVPAAAHVDGGRQVALCDLACELHALCPGAGRWNGRSGTPAAPAPQRPPGRGPAAEAASLCARLPWPRQGDTLTFTIHFLAARADLHRYSHRNDRCRSGCGRSAASRTAPPLCILSR